MAKFKDSTGVEWTIPEFTVFSIRSLRTRTGFDFNKVGDKGEELLKLLADKFLIYDLITLLTEDARKAKELSDEDFAKRFNGQTLNDAWDAIMEAFADFARGSKVAAAVMENLRPIHRKIEEQSITALKKLASDSPESAE